MRAFEALLRVSRAHSLVNPSPSSALQKAKQASLFGTKKPAVSCLKQLVSNKKQNGLSLRRNKLLFRFLPTPSTKERNVLPRPGSWDLGPPRMVDILEKQATLRETEQTF
jgi:hypothetical protein